MSKKEELIWVDKEFADRFNEAKSKKAERDVQIQILEDYMKTVTDASKSDFKANLECLEEDVAIYSGLMLHVKQAFNKAKDEALTSSYALWEEYEKDMPNVGKKTKAITDSLNPFLEKLKEINAQLDKINTYKFDKVIETVAKFNGMSDESKKVMRFLFDNFNGVT